MTSTFFQRLLIIILLAGTVPTLWAQEYKYEIGGMAGGAFYMGDANKNTIFKGMNPAVGAVFRYNINFRWALKANLMWGQVSGKTEGMENVFPNNAQTSFNRSIMELGGQAEFNFFPYSDKFDYAGARRSVWSQAAFQLFSGYRGARVPRPPIFPVQVWKSPQYRCF